MKNIKYIRIKKHAGTSQKGFTLFVALIVTSLLLAVSFSLSDIILKQLIFSQSARESQISFYAADSAAECAIFWDRKDAFGTTTPYGAFATSTELNAGNFYDIYCGYGTDGLGKVGTFYKEYDPLAATTTFYVDFHDAISPSGISGQKAACAKVVVSKVASSTDSSVIHTTIDSRGYNAPFVGQAGLIGTPPTGWGQGSCQIDNNRIIERAIRVDL